MCSDSEDYCVYFMLHRNSGRTLFISDGRDGEGDFAGRGGALEGGGRVGRVGGRLGELDDELVVLRRAGLARDLERRRRTRIHEAEDGLHGVLRVVGGLHLKGRGPC